MKLLTIVLLTVGSVYAQDFLPYKDAAVSSEYPTQLFTKAWSSDTPACIKDGSKIVAVNKAYRANGLGYSDCTQKQKKSHKIKGFRVSYFKFDLLPDAIAKKAMGK